MHSGLAAAHQRQRADVCCCANYLDASCGSFCTALYCSHCFKFVAKFLLHMLSCAVPGTMRPRAPRTHWAQRQVRVFKPLLCSSSCCATPATASQHMIQTAAVCVRKLPHLSTAERLPLTGVGIMYWSLSSSADYRVPRGFWKHCFEPLHIAYFAPQTPTRTSCCATTSWARPSRRM
jgi:hypothetical protein